MQCALVNVVQYWLAKLLLGSSLHGVYLLRFVIGAPDSAEAPTRSAAALQAAHNSIAAATHGHGIGTVHATCHAEAPQSHEVLRGHGIQCAKRFRDAAQ